MSETPHFYHVRQAPAATARAAVRDYWVLQAERCRAAVEASFPDTCAEIYVNLGPTGREVFTTGLPALRPRAAWVVGPRARTLLVAKETRDCDVVGIRLETGALAQVLNAPAWELAGQMVDLDVFWGSAVNELREQLHASPEPRVRMRLVERALLERLARRTRLAPRVDQVLTSARGCAGPLSVAEVARAHGLTHRQVIEYFDQHVGLKPKQYQRVHRLRHVLRAIHAPRRASWAQLAVRCGYFDQAHLIHDFRKLTGYTPTHYEQQRMSVGQGFMPHVLASR